jgi:cytochrome c oxidase accessory protein FixG
MFDRDTLIVSYDPGRGEPRGSRSRRLAHSELRAAGQGDCIDCTLCVQVCPTGIDIRQGLQYECIGCGACIDVCNGVMDKMDYPRGLIRMATENGLAQGWGRAQLLRRVLRPRVLIYGAVLLAIGTAFVASLALHQPFRVDVVRDRGSLARLVEDGRIENVYRLQIMNATEAVQHYRVSVTGLAGAQLASAAETVVGPAEQRWTAVSVQLSHAAAQEAGVGAHPIRFHVERTSFGADAPVTVDEASTFVVPR